jgi:hypothetical protein
LPKKSETLWTVRLDLVLRRKADIPVLLRNERHQEELHNVKEKPDGEEGADGDIEAISELQLLFIPELSKKTLSTPSG